ncbi:hypothetical protein LSUE1_G003697, partial [Lachnellula suecica]
VDPASTSTSTNLPSSSPNSATTQPPTGTSSTPPASSSPAADGNGKGAFNYYFLIIAGAAILFCILILYIGRRARRKQATLRSNSQQALARDVAGFRSRFGMRAGGRGGSGGGGNTFHFGGFGIGGGNGGHNAGQVERVEGLDERGEAPPPYGEVPSKPPSLRSVDLNAAPAAGARRSRGGEVVEMRPMSADTTGDVRSNPPDYRFNVVSADMADIARPTTALTANERFGSTRRLLSNTGSTTQS